MWQLLPGSMEELGDTDAFKHKSLCFYCNAVVPKRSSQLGKWEVCASERCRCRCRSVVELLEKFPTGNLSLAVS